MQTNNSSNNAQQQQGRATPPLFPETPRGDVLKGFGSVFAKDAKEILQVDRARDSLIIELNNAVSDSFKLQHSLDLNSQQYTFLTWLRRDAATLQASCGSTGLMTALIDYEWNPSITTRFRSEMLGNMYGHATMDAIYGSERFGAKFAIDRNRADASCVATADVAVRATDRFIVGAQIRNDPNKNTNSSNASGAVTADGVGEGSSSFLSRVLGTTRGAISAQYAHPIATATATMSSTGVLSAHCARRVAHYNRPGLENVGLAAEFIMSTKTGRSQVTLGSQFRLPNTKAEVSTSITGSGSFLVCVKERMSDWMLLRLTSAVNPTANDFKFGIGVQVGESTPKRPCEFSPIPVVRWHQRSPPYRTNKLWN